MDIQRIVVHDSVGIAFDPQLVVDALSGLSIPLTVASDPDLDRTDAVISFGPHPSFLDAAWVHCIRAGYDEFPVHDYADAGVVLTNSTGIHGTAIGESVLGYMLSLARRLHVFRDRQHDRTWEREPYENPFTLDGERVCVVGLGTLGTGVARRASALGMDVVGVRHSGRDHDHARQVYTPGELDAAVRDARFVVVCVPLNEETEGMISASTLASMPDSGYLINVARGAVVDGAALEDALDTDTIAGAALDVFEDEPLPPESSFWGREEVIVTPHASAMTNRYHEDVTELVRENLRRLDSNEDLTNRVV